jgi:hypothetical protein
LRLLAATLYGRNRFPANARQGRRQERLAEAEPLKLVSWYYIAVFSLLLSILWPGKAVLL